MAATAAAEWRVQALHACTPWPLNAVQDGRWGGSSQKHRASGQPRTAAEGGQSQGPPPTTLRPLLPASPALSQMMVGIWRRARPKAAMASDFLPGVRAARSSTTLDICTKGDGGRRSAGAQQVARKVAQQEA